MRVMRNCFMTFWAVSAIFAPLSLAIAANPAVTGPDEPISHLNIGPEPLHLTDSQRQQVRQAVMQRDTETTFQLKATKPLKNFAPKVGEKIPPHLPAHAFPATLQSDVPTLANYKYVRVKGKVLIVNPMTKKVVDMFSETR